MPPLTYRLSARLLHNLPLPHEKLRESVAGRRGAAERWVRWASTQRTNQLLVWVHAASVGEALTAAPVVSRLRRAVPGLQVVYSYSSPSAARWPGRFGADRADYVPLDEPRPVRQTLEAVRPSLLVCARGDLWPELLRWAATMDVPVAVIGGTVRASSRRLRWPVRSLFRRMYGSVNWLGAISPVDADRWVRLGVAADAVEMTGDPRHDQVIEQTHQLERVQPLLSWADQTGVLVAGSTDSRDEAMILEVFARVSRSSCSARLILAPHDLSGRRVTELLALAGRHGIAAESWEGGGPGTDARCLVVTVMGVLARLYLLAEMAYVGGGFRKGALHAVAEPAAYAVPVIVGPHWTCSGDAAVLLEAGGAVALPRWRPTAACARLWQDWAAEPDARIEAGLRARRALQQGAASRTATALLRLMQ